MTTGDRWLWRPGDRTRPFELTVLSSGDTELWVQQGADQVKWQRADWDAAVASGELVSLQVQEEGHVIGGS